jgi:HSP20 family protein
MIKVLQEEVYIMELVKWNPFRELESFDRRIGRVFNRSAFPSFWSGIENIHEHWRPVVDVYENENSVVLKADLPGVEKDHVEVDIKDHLLTIKGERSDEKEVKEENYHRKERFFGKFHRSFTLPEQVDPDKITAEFKDGVLKVEIPKPEETKPKQITVH